MEGDEGAATDWKDGGKHPKAHTSTAMKSSYLVGFKLRAIEHAEQHSNRAAARVFGLCESQVRSWRRRKVELQKLPPNRSTLRNRSGKYPALELRLKEWLRSQQAKGIQVNMVSLRFKALAYAQQSSLEFTAGASWAQRFLRRSGLRLRKTKKLRPALIEVPVDPASGDATVAPTQSPDGAPSDVDESVAANGNIPSASNSVNGSVGTAPNGGDGDGDAPSMSNFKLTYDSNGDIISANLDLHSRFRKCERRVLGVGKSTPPGLTFVPCQLCNQPFNFDHSAATNSGSVFQHMRVCAECRLALRTVRQLNGPVQDRLGALETAVALIKAQLGLRDAEDETSEARSSPEKEDSVARLRRENAKLRLKVRQLEQAVNGAKGKKAVGHLVVARSPTNQKRVIKKSPVTTTTTKKALVKRRVNRPVSPPSVSGTTTPTFSCFLCEAPFDTRQQLQRHVNEEHGATSATYQCPICPKQFTSQSTLQRHLKQHPTTTYEDTSEAAGGPVDDETHDVIDSAHSVFQCPFCLKTFVRSSSLQAHVAKCDPDQSGETLDTIRQCCRSCGKRITNARNLRAHETKCTAAAAAAAAGLHQAALEVECEIGDDSNDRIDQVDSDGDDANENDDDFFELANLIEPEVSISGNEIVDAETSDLMVQLNRFAVPPESDSITIKLEPLDNNDSVAD